MEQSQKPDTARDGNEVREELAKAKRDLARQEERNAQLEAKLFAAKHAAFMDYGNPDNSPWGDALVDLLRSGGSWRSDAIMKSLSIDPKNIDAIRSLAGQLRSMQDLKLVVEGRNGWRWADE